MLEENISEKSGFIRLALGAGITACGIAHLARDNSSRSLGSLLVTAGALKIAEGIFLYCPMKALISSNVKEAVSTSFENFLDGDEIMQAFRDTYANTNGQSNSQSSSTQGQSSSGSSSQGGLTQAATQVAQSVASGGSVSGVIAQAATSVAGSQQNNKSNNQNKQNNQKNNYNNNKNTTVNPS